ncbi:MAG: hypothetical protein DCC64_02035 [Planctomycetota bacterium]|nr:MAG: hypothetical protein DCC64_02035 [Planctomycetota bacterium]
MSVVIALKLTKPLVEMFTVVYAAPKNVNVKPIGIDEATPSSSAPYKVPVAVKLLFRFVPVDAIDWAL